VIQYGREDKTTVAVKYANKYFTDEHEFYRHYMNVDFQPDMSDVKLHEVIYLMGKYMQNESIEVIKWYPKWRWTKAIATTMGDGKIRLNARTMDREKGDIVETLVHETVHIVDNSCNEISFGHGDNSPKGKEKTAPYLIGQLANIYYTSGKLLTVGEINEL